MGISSMDDVSEFRAAIEGFHEQARRLDERLTSCDQILGIYDCGLTESQNEIGVAIGELRECIKTFEDVLLVEMQQRVRDMWEWISTFDNKFMQQLAQESSMRDKKILELEETLGKIQNPVQSSMREKRILHIEEALRKIQDHVQSNEKKMCDATDRERKMLEDKFRGMLDDKIRGVQDSILSDQVQWIAMIENKFMQQLPNDQEKGTMHKEMHHADCDQKVRVNQFMERALQLQEVSRKIQDRVQSNDSVHCVQSHDDSILSTSLPVNSTNEVVSHDSSMESAPPQDTSLYEVLSQAVLPQDMPPQNMQSVRGLPLQSAPPQGAPPLSHEVLSREGLPQEIPPQNVQGASVLPPEGASSSPHEVLYREVLPETMPSQNMQSVQGSPLQGAPPLPHEVLSREILPQDMPPQNVHGVQVLPPEGASPSPNEVLYQEVLPQDMPLQKMQGVQALPQQGASLQATSRGFIVGRAATNCEIARIAELGVARRAQRTFSFGNATTPYAGCQRLVTSPPKHNIPSKICRQGVLPPVRYQPGESQQHLPHHGKAFCKANMSKDGPPA